MKTALVTGASSGIGAEIAKRLDSLGFNVIITARRTDRLETLANELKNPSTVIAADLSVREECLKLYEQTRDSARDCGYDLRPEGMKTVTAFIIRTDLQ